MGYKKDSHREDFLWKQPNERGSQNLCYWKRDSLPNVCGELECRIYRREVRQSLSPDQVELIRQRAFFHIPLSLECIGARSDLTAAEIKKFQSPQARISANFPVHEIVRRELPPF